VKGPLEDPVGRGLKTGRKYPFVIDCSKALRSGIEAVLRPEESGAALPEPQTGEREL